MTAYSTVNAAWPEGTRDGRDLKPTPEEAVAAVRRLYRFAMKRPLKLKIKATSGNRRGGPRGGIWYINPDRWGGGWHEIVHHMSHHCAYRLWPGSKPHDPRHAWLEREMIAHVVKSGWLDGKLRRPEKPKPEIDVKTQRHGRVLASIKRWEAKARRAENALRKLRRKARHYERQQIAA